MDGLRAMFYLENKSAIYRSSANPLLKTIVSIATNGLFFGYKDTDIFSDLLFLYLLRERTFFGLWKRYEHLETKINNHSTSALGYEMADIDNEERSAAFVIIISYPTSASAIVTVY